MTNTFVFCILEFDEDEDDEEENLSSEDEDDDDEDYEEKWRHCLFLYLRNIFLKYTSIKNQLL